MANGEEDSLHPTNVLNIVFFMLILNVLVIGLSFGILSGVAAYLINRPDLSSLFGAATGLMAFVAVILGVLRSALIRFMKDWSL